MAPLDHRVSARASPPKPTLILLRPYAWGANSANHISYRLHVQIPRWLDASPGAPPPELCVCPIQCTVHAAGASLSVTTYFVVLVALAGASPGHPGHTRHPSVSPLLLPSSTFLSFISTSSPRKPCPFPSLCASPFASGVISSSLLSPSFALLYFPTRYVCVAGRPTSSPS